MLRKRSSSSASDSLASVKRKLNNNNTIVTSTQNKKQKLPTAQANVVVEHQPSLEKQIAINDPLSKLGKTNSVVVQNHLEQSKAAYPTLLFAQQMINSEFDIDQNSKKHAETILDDDYQMKTSNFLKSLKGSTRKPISTIVPSDGTVTTSTTPATTVSRQSILEDDSESDAEIKIKKRKLNTTNSSSSTFNSSSTTTDDSTNVTDGQQQAKNGKKKKNANDLNVMPKKNDVSIKKYKRKTDSTIQLHSKNKIVVTNSTNDDNTVDIGDKIHVVQLVDHDMVNKQTPETAAEIVLQNRANTEAKIQKLEKTARKNRMIAERDNNADRAKKADELELQVMMAEDKNVPLQEQRLSYPYNFKELDAQQQILDLLDGNQGRNELAVSGSNHSASIREFIRSTNGQISMDLKRSMVMKFLRDTHPETFMHQSRNDPRNSIDHNSTKMIEALDIPVRLYDDEEAWMVVPNIALGQRFCCYGSNCQGTKVPGAKPKILREYIPLSEREKAQREPLTDELRPCVLCGRKSICDDYMAIRSTADDVKDQYTIQNYRNEVNTEGEYDLRQCFMSSSTEYQGMPHPVVIHCLYWYKERTDGVEGYLQSGYIKYQSEDKFWKQMYEKDVPDFLEGLAK